MEGRSATQTEDPRRCFVVHWVGRAIPHAEEGHTWQKANDSEPGFSSL